MTAFGKPGQLAEKAGTSGAFSSLAVGNGSAGFACAGLPGDALGIFYILKSWKVRSAN